MTLKDGKEFGFELVHEFVNAGNTHTDVEFQSDEMERKIFDMKRRIAKAAKDADAELAVVWAALHGLACDMLMEDKGEEFAEHYLAALREYATWPFRQQVEE